MKIYADCLLKGLESIGNSPEEITLIDYGGGSGFLSMLAKQAGIGRVIYIDLNPDSVDTIRILKELVNTGPDIILHGDSDTLADWCSANKVKPQLLIATDLIEHVYDLSAFFANLIAIDNKTQMLFTTASTLICLGINGLIRISGKAGFLLAPFITLHLQGDNKGR